MWDQEIRNILKREKVASKTKEVKKEYRVAFFGILAISIVIRKTTKKSNNSWEKSFQRINTHNEGSRAQKTEK